MLQSADPYHFGGTAAGMKNINVFLCFFIDFESRHPQIWHYTENNLFYVANIPLNYDL